jgi:hypothetical protein
VRDKCTGAVGILMEDKKNHDNFHAVFSKDGEDNLKKEPLA